FIGVDAYDRLPEILAAAASAGGAGTLDGAVILGEPAARRGAGFGGTDAKVRGTAGSAGRRLGLDAKAPGTAALARKRLGPDYTAFVKIAEGCDNRCTYCVIPDIRGPFRSRGMEDILEECEGLAARGAKEIILIAQDLTAYGIDRYKEYLLPRLARQICGMDGIRWLRLMYCYEDRVTEELIETMAAEEKICHYIDLPLQHASDRILSAMRRRSDKAGILHTIGRLRAAMPDIHIRTTLITGFPGETKADFEELLEFAASARFERLGAFAYSREENTPAAAMEGQVRADVKRSRRDRLLRLQQGISLELNRAKIGREMEVLVEEREPDGSFSGRTRYDAPEIDNGVIFSADGADLKPGELVRVRINDAFDYDLAGEFIKSMEPQ
ncbi:MAG: MiaB/RimO family radical SAM methylthiotransferase, partial [Clostridiales Family XIII bacterium]|nr:MiaB/RimO family radical SAM methylthiotransferase [Clostridiales Family XIII bacterium]